MRTVARTEGAALPLDTITDADIAAALDSPPIEADTPNFAELVNLAGQELMRRFREEPDSLPGTFVIKLYLDGMKAVAAGNVPDAEDPGTVDVLAALDSLPPEHARALLETELVRLRALTDAYQDTLLGLEPQ